MIVTKTPVRISLGAGGIDLPIYYRKFGAKFVTSAGSKHVYVMVNRHPEKVVWMGMYRAERVDRPEQLSHPVVSRVLQWMGIRRNIEIVSMSDVPPNSGVGTSSSFVVGLLNALHAFNGEYLWPQEIAEKACYVEQVLLKEKTGKQDPYAAAFGGIVWLEISKDGRVDTSRLGLKPEFIKELNDHIAFYYTGVQRSSSQMQDWQSIRGADKHNQSIEKLRRIQQIALEIKQALLNDDIQEFGRLIDEHWKHKRRLSQKISSADIDRIYRLAMKSGAVGGNLMGAGGGGYYMFVCRDKTSKGMLRKTLSSTGLEEIAMSFEMKGSAVTRLA